MKKMKPLALGLALVLGTAAVGFASDETKDSKQAPATTTATKKHRKHHKKGGKKAPQSTTTPAPAK